MKRRARHRCAPRLGIAAVGWLGARRAAKLAIMSAKPIAASLENDPVLAALERAPMGAPETDEEQRLVTAAKAGDRFVRAADVERSIAERARHEG